jgi:O-antigen ligase
MSRRRTSPAELVALVLFFAFLLWVPLPFGSTPDAFQLPLVTGGVLICAIAAVAVARAGMLLTAAPAWRIWTVGAIAFMGVVGFQLIDMPDALLRAFSPESARIWASASSVTSSVLGPRPGVHPISVDPATTSLHLFRLLAYFGAFTTAALLIRRHTQRLALAVVLSCSGIFQAAYGIREAALHRFSIWGWKNTLIFNRATGTFVNPNHYANYAALVAPLGFLVLCWAWHDASPSTVRVRFRFLRLLERRLVPAAFGAIAVVACLAAILVSKSRGALLALFAGAAIGFAAATGRRVVRTTLFLAAGVLAVVVIALYLGRERTTATRLIPDAQDVRSFGGRRPAMETAMAIWRRYPLFGSGLGTFIDVAPMTQPGDSDRIYNHAHNDYAEIAATTGVAGLAVFAVPLAFGLMSFARRSFGASAVATTWRRSTFQAAVLASISVALVHALVDFNFFIPANAVTLAAIAGSAVAMRVEPRAVTGSALEDSQA